MISNEPALLTLNGGSRIEMTKAEASFARRGETLVVGANRGLLRFNFTKGENVRIDAGKFQFASVNDTGHIGELGLSLKRESFPAVTR